MPTKRAAFYFDGFNLYHALDALRQQHLKWLSLRDLANLLIPSRDEELRSVVYFTAYLTHRPDKLVRHRAYVAALEATGVECVLGRFKYSDVRCRSCGSQWRSYEEKETDVNIGIRIVGDAFRDVFDVYYLVSADTDLAPAIAVQLIDTAKNILTDESRTLAGGVGQPPKLLRRLNTLAAAFRRLTT